MKKRFQILILLNLFFSQITFGVNEFVLFDLYKELHANPELSYQEIETSARLAVILKEMGYEVTEGFGGTGVVAILKNGKGKTIMLRADMDGLPVKERTGVSYSSKKKVINLEGQEVFTMHACGHDIHMTVLIGAARALIESRNKWQGTLILILQPAEEVSGGARAMLREGLYTK